MRPWIAAALVLGAVGFLLWKAFDDRTVPCFRVEELLANGYRKECRVDGVIGAIEPGSPRVFTVVSPDHPDLVLRVRSTLNPPEYFKPGGRVACWGRYRDGEFLAADIMTSSHSRYGNQSLAGARKA